MTSYTQRATTDDTVRVDHPKHDLTTYSGNFSDTLLNAPLTITRIEQGVISVVMEGDEAEQLVLAVLYDEGRFEFDIDMPVNDLLTMHHWLLTYTPPEGGERRVLQARGDGVAWATEL